MSSLQFKPESGATPADYLSVDEKNNLQQANNAVNLSSYKESDFYLKSISDNKYLSVDKDGWLKISSKSCKWKAFWDGSIDDSRFALQAKSGSYKNYYIGHKTSSILAGVYYWWNASDWLEFKENGSIINNVLDDKTLAQHTNGYLYWINRTQARSSSYTVLYFKKGKA